jgi:xanthine dehydrogenase YagS FAD-binding subunit
VKPFDYRPATSLAGALRALQEPGAVAKAGGTDLLDRMKEGLVHPATLVSLWRIAGLDGVRDDGKAGARIGALTTLAALAGNPVLRKRYPVIAEAAAHVATPPIRNMATLGGNLVQRPRCWYFRSADFNCRKKGGEVCFAQSGENQLHAIAGNHTCAALHPSTMAVALIACGATVRLASAATTRDLPLEQFFAPPEADVTRENQLQPGELVTELLLPAPAASTRSAYLKQGEKESFDWPLAEVAVVLEVAGGTCRKATVVLGAFAPVPLRSPGAEGQLVKKRVDEPAAAAAARAALIGVTPMTHNHYKVAVFETVIRRAILAAARGGA